MCQIRTVSKRLLLALLTGLALFNAGCVESERPLVATSEGRVILPDHVFISNGKTGPENTFLLHRKNTRYLISTANKKYASAVFTPLKSNDNYLIAQLTRRSGGYAQALIKIQGRKIISHVVAANGLIKEFHLGGLKTAKDAFSMIATTRPALDALFEAAVGHPTTKTQSFTIYDIDNPTQSKEALALIAKLEVADKKLQQRRAQQEAKKQAVRVPQRQANTTSSSGRWRYQRKGRLAGKRPQPLVIGTPVFFEGAGRAPILAFRCGRNQPLISVHWSVAVRPIMDDGKKAFMAVDIGFDKTKPQLLVFASSKDHKTLYEMADIAKPMFSSSAKVLQFLRADYQRTVASWNARDLTRAMRRATYMTMRASDSSRRPMVARYKVSDFARVVSNFPARCR